MIDQIDRVVLTEPEFDALLEYSMSLHWNDCRQAAEAKGLRAERGCAVARGVCRACRSHEDWNSVALN